MNNYFDQHYPHISDLLSTAESNDSILHRSKKVKNGYTLLMPNRGVADTIVTMFDSDEHDANSELACHIIPCYLPNPNSWPDSVPNLHNRTLKVPKTSRDRVTISDGSASVVARLINTPAVFARSNVAVYELQSAVPKPRERFTTVQEQAPDQKPAAPVKSRTSPVRKQVYNAVTTGINVRQACTRNVASFLNFLETTHSGFYESILPLLDHCMLTSFVLLFEPGKGSNYLVPDELLDEWANSNEKFDDHNTTLIAAFEAAGKLECVAYKQSREVVKQINNLRNDVIDEHNPAVIIKNINSVYNTLIVHNKIGNLAGVLPQKTQQLLRKNTTAAYNFKLAQDEIRLHIAQQFGEVPDKEILAEMYGSIKLFPRLNSDLIVESLGANAFSSAAAEFGITTYFMYITPSAVGQFGGQPTHPSAVDINANYVADPTAFFAEML